MTENPTTTQPEVLEDAVEPTDQDVAAEQDVDLEPEQHDEGDTFPREYVEKLRQQAAGYRQKAADRDTLAQRLHASLVAADGRLASPDELAFDEAHLGDPDALTAAIDDLLARKPYLAARRITGDVGQGVSPVPTSVDLAGLIRRNAG